MALRYTFALHLQRGLPSQSLSTLLVRSYRTVAPLPETFKKLKQLANYRIKHNLIRTNSGGLHFCGTILTLTRTGHYPATSPMVPGLSSFLAKRGSLRCFTRLYQTGNSPILGNHTTNASRQRPTKYGDLLRESSRCPHAFPHIPNAFPLVAMNSSCRY